MIKRIVDFLKRAAIALFQIAVFSAGAVAGWNANEHRDYIATYIFYQLGSDDDIKINQGG